MTLRIVLLIMFCCTTSFAQKQGVPLVVIDNRTTPRWKLEHLALFRRFGFDKDLEKQGALDYWKTDAFSKYRDENSHRGYVWLVGKDGQLEQTHLVTVKNDKAFEAYVTDKVEKLKQRLVASGKAPELRTSGNITSIITPPYQFGDRNQFKTLAWEVHLKYSRPVLMNVTGRGSLTRAKRLPVEKVADQVRMAKGHMWHLRYRPSECPRHLRQTALAAISKAAGVGLQQRDTESAEAYQLRRAASDARLRLLEMLAGDVSELVAFTEWPQESSESFHAHLRLGAKKGTGLSKVIESLRFRGRALDEVRGTIGQFRLSLSCPAILEPIVRNYLVELLGRDSQNAVEKVLQEGFSGAGRISDDNGWTVSGAFAKPISTQLVLSIIDKGLPPSGTFQAKILGKEVQQITYRLSDIPGKGIAFVLSSDSAADSPNETPTPSVRTNALISLELDFAPLLRSETSRTRMLEIDRALTTSSILDRFDGEGDWTFSLSARTTRNQILVDIKMGYALHAFWRIREQIRLYNSGGNTEPTPPR